MANFKDLRDLVKNELSTLLSPFKMEVIDYPSNLSQQKDYAYMKPTQVSYEYKNNMERQVVYTFEVVVHIRLPADVTQRRALENKLLDVVEDIVEHFRTAPNWLRTLPSGSKVFVRQVGVQMMTDAEVTSRVAVVTIEIVRYV